MWDGVFWGFIVEFNFFFDKILNFFFIFFCFFNFFCEFNYDFGLLFLASWSFLRLLFCSPGCRRILLLALEWLLKRELPMIWILEKFILANEKFSLIWFFLFLEGFSSSERIDDLRVQFAAKWMNMNPSEPQWSNLSQHSRKTCKFNRKLPNSSKREKPLNTSCNPLILSPHSLHQHRTNPNEHP